MNKDIIYIDVEDDVTSIIGKVRASTEKIVALVPPKNIGSLQSAVNLRLLQKAADNAGKRIVLITSNSGLTALAAGVKIPVAKNLQSKPEIPAIAEQQTDPEDDVIRGEELPVGELAAATNAAVAIEAAKPPVSVASGPFVPVAPKVSEDDITIEDLPDLDSPQVAVAAVGSAKKAKGGHVLNKVPNFAKFRKLIFIGGGLIVAIVAFFVLTNIFWTNATVVITAQTTDEDVNLPLTLSADGATNPDQDTIKVDSKQLKKTASVDFTPTGKKNVGEKATGTVKFSSNDADIVLAGTTIDAGTALSSSDGSIFLTNSAVTINATNYRGVNVDVTAKNQGTESNTATGAVTGAPSGVTAALTAATSGGTDKTVTVVSSDDITAATAKLAATNATAAKSELTGNFGTSYVVIGESFTSVDATPVSSPVAGTEATTAKLSRDSTYTMAGVNKDQIKIVSTAYLNSQISGDNNQKIYSDGSNSASVSQFVTSPSGVMTGRILATGKIGPNIDIDTLKPQLVNKKSAEITQFISNTNGVKDVKVSFAPFWRSTAPSADKIKISFDLNDGK